LDRELIARAASASRPVVLIDGRSGAGKSSLAAELAPALGAQLVSLDDLYPGWDGLAAGSAAVHETVLRAVDPGWRRWDWASARAVEWHPVDPGLPVVIEGCGALSRANRAIATFGIWVELDAAERRRRALERDASFAAHWDRWAAQERDHIAREHPRALADWIVTG
jgi:uridine kinase